MKSKFRRNYGVAVRPEGSNSKEVFLSGRNKRSGPEGWRFLGLGGAPMVGNFLVVEVPDAGNERRMLVLSCPVDRFLLGLEGAEHVVRVVLNNEVIDRASFRAAPAAFF